MNVVRSFVFISYAKEDKETANTICKELESRNIKCWIAFRDISPAQVWAKAIVKAIAESELLVLLLTRHSNESIYVYKELERAVSNKKVIITIRLEDIEPGEELQLFISGIQWFDVWKKPMESYIDELTKIIKDYSKKDKKKELEYEKYDLRRTRIIPRPIENFSDYVSRAKKTLEED
jgi:hypothetical protein